MQRGTSRPTTPVSTCVAIASMRGLDGGRLQSLAPFLDTLTHRGS